MLRVTDRGALALLAISLCGIAISVYLTIAHYSGAPLACIQQGIVDCGAVTTSSFSVIGDTGIPISIPGLLWFVVGAVVAAAAVRGTDGAPLRIGYFVWTVGGILVVLYLVRAELVVIGRICEWCSVLHVLIAISFLIAIRRLQTIG